MDEIEDLLFSDQLTAKLDFKQAYQHLTQALKKNKTWRLHAKRAEVLLQVGDSARALKDLSCAITQARNQDCSELELARLYSRHIIVLWSLSNWSEIQPTLQKFAQRFEKKTSNVTKKCRPRLTDVLRIGYLSPDFRVCSAAMMLETYFGNHVDQNVTIYAYDLTNSGDAAQAYFKQNLPHWRNLAGKDLSECCAQIESDDLDVLIDLAGHTSLSGLAILGQKPAPLQFSGLTFNGPTGLDSVLRFSDSESTPTPLMNEQVCYLPSWIIIPYQPALPGRQIADIPRRGKALGCAHHPGRISPQTLACWADILKSRPNTELHLKHRLYQSTWCRERFQAYFLRAGIQPERLHFYPVSPYLEYLTFYQHMDLVLDPFPYHGGLVSCDALWMGVPMVTMAEWMRGGASLLKQVGFDSGIAYHRDQYISQAIDILDQVELRKEAARTFRAAMQQSPVCQADRMVASVLGHIRKQTQEHDH